MIFNQLIQTNLRTKELGKKVEYYNRLESTNEEAWELIDDDKQETIVSASSLGYKTGTKTEKSVKVGKDFAKRAKEKKIKMVKIEFDL